MSRCHVRLISGYFTLLELAYCNQRAQLDDVATLATSTLYLLFTEVEFSTRD